MNLIRSRYVGIALLVGLGVVVAVPANAARPERVKGGDGRIVFRRYLDVARTSAAIFTVNPDGTGARQVTHPAAGVIDTEPDWSSDGTKIAFERQEPCPADGPRNGLNNTCDLVFTTRRDGSGPRPFVPCGFQADAPFPGNCVGVDQPGWSPDGSKIAFQYNLSDPRYTGSLTLDAGIWIANADGSGAHQVTQRTPGQAWDFGPQWSPDGRRLVFFRRDLPTDTEAIFTVAVDGSHERQVSPAGLNAANPNWSPDGRWILFNAEAQDGSSNLYRVRPDGSGLARITNEAGDGFHYLSASYSPDGTMIATARTPGTGPEGAADVFVMDADGSDIRPVTQTRLWDSGADWGRAPN
jgi:Tol biopolymer transport system component